MLESRKTVAFIAVLTSVLTACSDASTGASRAGKTVPAEATKLVSPIILAAGDIADCNNIGDEATALLLDAQPAEAVLALGDLAYESGTLAQFNNCYNPTWGRHKARTRPAPGNHEYLTSGAAGYFSYFGPIAGPSARGYYSFDLGAWHILSLNSNVAAGAGSAQIDWIRDDLAAHPTACALAYWHHPVISSGQHGNNSVMREVWRVLDELGVEVVLVGHDHNYERFAPQTSTGVADANGIREFVVGTGGRSLRSFSTIRANSQVRNSDTWGLLRMVLNPTSYEWNFIPVAGRTFTDQGTANCVQGTTPTPTPNRSPTATLTQPVDGATVTAPATITMSANASDVALLLRQFARTSVVVTHNVAEAFQLADRIVD